MNMKNLYKLLIFITVITFSLSGFSSIKPNEQDLSSKNLLKHLPKPDFESFFQSKKSSVMVSGQAFLYLNKTKADKLYLVDFNINDGVVLEVKVCGKINLKKLSKEICLSAGNLKGLNGVQSYRVPYKFAKYTKIVIYDLDLFENLAFAKF